MTELTADERTTIRDAALGAMALVSRADPGFFATFKESMAGSKALAAAPESIRELLKADGLPTPPRGSVEEVTRQILDQLSAAVGVLQGKAPEQVEPYKQVILSACDAVANASKGVAPQEQAAIDQIRQALASGGLAVPEGTPPPAPTA
jgi:hypothetical protein